MNKLVTLFLVFWAVLAQAQTTLPTSWDCDGTEPTGYELNTGGQYGSTGNDAPPSVKLSADGHYIQISFFDAPGTFSYYLKGQTGGGSDYEGTVTIQESVDGSSFDDVATYFDADISSSEFRFFQNELTSTSRIVRIFYTDKISGSNLAVDDILLEKAAAGADAEIEMTLNGTTVPVTTTLYTGADVSSSVNLDFSVKNEGSAGSLELSNISLSTFTGTFSSAQSSLTVAAGETKTLTVTFTPLNAGTDYATLTFTTNDSDEGAFQIELVGYGDNLATEPTAAAELSVSATNTFRGKATNSGAASSEGYLVLRKTSPITELPVDGEAYAKGDVIGGASVAYVGTENNFDIRNVYDSETHYFKAFPFNGVMQYTNYFTTATEQMLEMPTSDGSPATYAGLDPLAASFVSDLRERVEDHTQIYYSNFDETFVTEFAARDTVDGQRALTCSYTSDIIVYTEPFVWDVFSREHSFAYSWMPITNQDAVPYSDMFNLYPVNQNKANAVRSNYPFGEVETVTSEYLDGKLGKNSEGQTVYEPRDAQKGDAARSLFYMATVYNSTSENWSLPEKVSQFVPYGQDMDLLLKWHEQDLPNGWERSKNDYIESVQGNRNPFIDNPEYACYINFMDMTHIDSPTCTLLGVENTEAIQWSVYPNPATSAVFVQVDGSAQLTIVDLTGKAVSSIEINNNTRVSTANLVQGVYVFKLLQNGNTAVKKVLIK